MAVGLHEALTGMNPDPVPREILETDAGTPPRSGASQLLIELIDNQAWIKVEQETLIDLARGVLRDEGVTQAEISMVLVDDATSRQINNRHLEHDWPTDVISFPLSELEDPVLRGELVVSTEMAVTTASRAGVDPRHELALYLVHGLLHLCGVDDRTAEDAHRMRLREQQALARAGVPNTFEAVTTEALAAANREDAR